MTKYMVLLGLLLCLAACQDWESKKLWGRWQGAAVLEDGMPMPVTPGEIGFEFLKNGYYTYRGTLKYRETGTWSVKGGLLYTMDTLNEASSEKAVQILLLTEDSLFLKMNADGKEQEMQLARVR